MRRTPLRRRILRQLATPRRVSPQVATPQRRVAVGYDDGPALGAAQRGQHCRPEYDERDRVRDRATQVPAARRRQQRVDPEPLQVLLQRRPGHERQLTCVALHLDAQGERPARHVQQESVGEGREDPVDHQHRDLPGSPDASREEPRTHPDPGRGEHLERQPRPHSRGQQRRGEQRGAPEHEAEAGPEHPATEDQQEEDQLDAGHAGAEPAHHHVDGGQHPEHGEDLGVHPAFGELREAHRDHHREQQREDERRLDHLALEPDAHQQRPQEHHQPGERGHRQHGCRPEAHGQGHSGRPAPRRTH